MKEIDLSDVPLTPGGKNHDFNAVKNFEFVRVDEVLAWKTASLIEPDDSDQSEVEEDDFKTSKNLTKADLQELLNSPMVEVRKRKPSTGPRRFNPVNNDVMETSRGWHNNYEKSKRKTIAVMRRMSIEVPPAETRARKSMPSISGAAKENIDPVEKKLEISVECLDLLRESVDESRPLLCSERDRLGVAIVDWRHILERENDEIPATAQGEIQAMIGSIQILLDKRLKATLVVLDAAQKFIDNEGRITEDQDKQYWADDIYAFVDLLVAEIKRVDRDYTRLIGLRDNKWVEPAATASTSTLDAKKKPATKKVPLARAVPAAKSRLDLASLRRLQRQQQQAVSAAPLVDIRVPQSHRSPAAPLVVVPATDSRRASLRRQTVRDNSLIKSATGTPVHRDTPRPPRSTKAPEFLEPSPAPPASGSKRSAVDTEFQRPGSQPKKARKSKLL